MMTQIALVIRIIDTRYVCLGKPMHVNSAGENLNKKLSEMKKHTLSIILK